MSQSKVLYEDEPQYTWHVLKGDVISDKIFIPCKNVKNYNGQTDISILDSLPKGRIWYHFNTEVFVDTPQNNIYNQLFMNKIQQKDFSLSVLTTSKTIMKYVNLLQSIRNVEVGVYFSSDAGQGNIFTQKLDTLRRLFYSNIYTIAYINIEGDITDALNLAELLSGLCHTAYLYGSQHEMIRWIQRTFEEHNKTVFIFSNP
ncbi:MAG: hypothetical protein NZ455_02650 [Bacteroidia bacterium]|nr:hypothetical protein [Bacteroidia bacterium]MDW8347307.1 hypothetical protein [Bacteroidia bacterium]